MPFYALALAVKMQLYRRVCLFSACGLGACGRKACKTICQHLLPSSLYSFLGGRLSRSIAMLNSLSAYLFCDVFISIAFSVPLYSCVYLCLSVAYAALCCSHDSLFSSIFMKAGGFSSLFVARPSILENVSLEYIGWRAVAGLWWALAPYASRALSVSLSVSAHGDIVPSPPSLSSDLATQISLVSCLPAIEHHLACIFGRRRKWRKDAGRWRRVAATAGESWRAAWWRR